MELCQIEKYQMGTIQDKIGRIKEALGVSKNYEVADILGISRNQISHWATREKVPEKYLLEVSRKSGYSVQWLDSGSELILNGHRHTNETETAYEVLDRKLLIEAASIIKEAELRLNVQIRPDKLGELILMLY